jgi:serine-type D-Ala-D-Ala carboxypeptidase (penicillin-binding protein 5/6)
MTINLRVIVAALSVTLALTLPARAFETRADAAWVFDVGTHAVLMQKNADLAVPPASMSKLMTVNMLFEALQDGRVTMDTTFGVSARAHAMGGSTMFLNEQDRPTVRELIQGMVVNSGNDACVVVAEGLAGSEDAFAAQMTERAKALGMTGSNFANASGWPDPSHRMTMHDLGILALRLIEEFPEEYKVFAETEYNYADRAPDNRFNRNPLLKMGIGADGLKTGHTEEAGYGLVGSAVQGDRRVIVVISGLASEKERSEEAESLVNWAFRQFAQKTVAKAGVRVAEADIWMGTASTVGLVPAKDVRILVPALVQETMTAEVVYSGPLTAPIMAGQEVAKLLVHVPDLPDIEVPLVAEADVGKGGFLKRLTSAAQTLIAEIQDRAAAS